MLRLCLGRPQHVMDRLVNAGWPKSQTVAQFSKCSHHKSQKPLIVSLIESMTIIAHQGFDIISNSDDLFASLIAHFSASRCVLI